jgi:hypothetical protein
MSRIVKSIETLAAWSLAILGILSSSASAGEVLVNGNLEASVAPPFWTLTTSVTGVPGSTYPEAVEHVDGADHFVSGGPNQPGLGLLLHPQRGNQGIYEDQDKGVNMVLEQIFTSNVVPGRTYTFRGDRFFQGGYSGIVDPLNPLYPKGDYNSDGFVDAVDYTVWRNNLDTDFELPNEGPNVTQGEVTAEDYDYWKGRYGNAGRPEGVDSPTQTKYEIAFLNNSDTVLATNFYDLRNDTTVEAWSTNEVSLLAPVGATKARLRVIVENMRDNCCALGQDVFFDNFGLYDSFAPTGNRLVMFNGNLNTPGEPAGWTVTEGPTGMATVGGATVLADTIAFIGFGNRLSDVPNPNPTPPYATLPTGKQGLWLRSYVNVTQFEPDLPDVFGHASQTVAATPGAQYEFSAWSAWESGYSGGIPGTSTETFLKMEFLNGVTVLDTEYLDIADAGQVPDDNSGTDENGGNVEFDDWRQFFVNGVAPASTTHVRVSVGATGMFFNDFDGFQAAFFDEMSLIETAPGAGGLASVPEPTSLVITAIAVALAVCIQRPRPFRSQV